VPLFERDFVLLLEPVVLLLERDFVLLLVRDPALRVAMRAFVSNDRAALDSIISRASARGARSALHAHSRPRPAHSRAGGMLTHGRADPLLCATTCQNVTQSSATPTASTRGASVR
jgi:hypothetical protein